MTDGLNRVGILGAGTMGSGIAINLAMHGRDVILVDNDLAVAERAKQSAMKFYQRAVEKNRMRAEDAETATSRISSGDSHAAFESCDLVIEAVFEDFDLKAKVLTDLGKHIRRDAVVATNTSCLRVSDLGNHIENPERFLGLHYFSPAAINPVVEVVQGAATSPEATQTAMQFCSSTGKNPIQCKDSFGFAVNRFFCPYTNEAAHALDEGLGTTADIDAVAQQAIGAAAGPFLVMNLIKPRINLHAIQNLSPLGSFYAPAASMTKTGNAEQSWEIGEPSELDPAIRDQIVDHLLRGAFLPVLQALDEQVAEPAAFDQGATQALKFGKPPCALMDELGRAEVSRIIEPALRAHGISMPASIERIGTLLA